MIERYTRAEMGALWTDQARLESWLETELAVLEVLTARGLVPEAEMAVIREKAAFDVDEIARIEAEVGHDIVAFLGSVARHVGPASRHVQYRCITISSPHTGRTLTNTRNSTS